MQWIIPLVIIIILLAYVFIRAWMQRRYTNILKDSEFREGYRKAQLIDVREPNEFDNGHILGARNIPLTQLKMRHAEIRKDKPVYLYCANSYRSTRAAAMLKKYGCTDLNILHGGFKQWTGKVRKTK